MHDIVETFDPEGRGLLTTWPLAACLHFLPSLTVHCRACSRRLRSPTFAMALQLSVASQPYMYHLGDVSYVTLKTRENY